MTAPYLGGFRITGAGWLSSHSLIVNFQSSHGTSFTYQLYAGRTLIGVSRSPSARQVAGNLKPSLWPQHLTLLAVDPAEALTDYGGQLPKRPYNKVRFTFAAAGWPSDTKTIELSAGTVVGGAVDAGNIVERIFYAGDGVYEIFSPPMPGSGQWNFEIAGRDNRPPEGNRGTALAVSANVLAHPPDVVLQADNTRFSVEITGGVATASFELP